MDKRKAIKNLVKEMLEDSHEKMLQKIDKVLNSGCVDIEGWDSEIGKMVLPKCIVAAIIEDEARQYYGRGTSFEKQVKKEIKNIKNFI